MTTETGITRTRRAVLTAALAAGFASVASALGRPAPVRAGSDGDVVLGAFNPTTTTTTVTAGTSGTIGLHGVSDNGYGIWGASKITIGAYGTSTSYHGVAGESTSGIGVHGQSTSSLGVWGGSTSGTGVEGYNTATDQPAIFGWAAGSSSGVHGYSGSSVTLASPAKTGVYGYSGEDAASRGVHGQSISGRGVYGQAGNGTGVRGYSTTGTGGYFSTAVPTTGTALRVVGRVRFDNSVGSATILSGTKSIVVTPGTDLTATSIVTATLMGSAGGAMVERVSVNALADTFTIYLNANSTANVKVGWHVFG